MTQKTSVQTSLPRQIFDMIKASFTEWNEDGAPRLAASLAYYTVFSLAPLLIIIIAVMGLIVSEEAVRSDIMNQVQRSIGPEAAQFVRDLIKNMTQPSQGIISTVLGTVALLLGALGVFDNLQVALDIIWDVEIVKLPGGVINIVKNKLLSFGMLLVVGFLLLISLVISTVLSAMDSYLISRLPGGDFLLQLISFAISFGVITLLFALIYKYLPHVRLEWRDVWVGAAVTAMLFTIGKTLLSLYLARSSTVSPYGAAGAFVLILLWVYYSAQIILFGAEFTQVYARRHGSKAPEPVAGARLVPDDNKKSFNPYAGTKSGSNRKIEAPEVTPPPPTRRGLIADIIFGLGVVILGFIASKVQPRTDSHS